MGDMLNAVDAYVTATYGSDATAYLGPDGDGTWMIAFSAMETAITPMTAEPRLPPLTILHHDDSHGNLAKGTYVGYTQLAT